MSKYRIKEIKVGRKNRYQIQKCAFLFLWQTVMNPLIVNMNSPFEFRERGEAEKKITQLSA